MTGYKTLDELSHKESNYISEAINEAKQSPVKIRHGAIAMSGGRIIAKGFNHYRTQSANGYMGGSTCHAECDVLHKLLKLQTNKNNQRRKITVYIVRIGQSNELRESAPCHDCYEKMLFFGIKKIAFTTETEDGDIKVFETPICDYVPSVVTTGQRWISREIID